MTTLIKNKKFDAYIGRKGVNYLIWARGMNEPRNLSVSFVKLFVIDPRIKTNRDLFSFINECRTYTINGDTASEWVHCYLPEGTLKGYAKLTVDHNNEPVVDFRTQATKMTDMQCRSFTPLEFGCWFSSTYLPVQVRRINNNRLTLPEPLLNKSEEAIQQLQQANIEKSKRYLKTLLDMLSRKVVDISYNTSYLHTCGKPGEPYKMLLVVSMDVIISRDKTKRIEIGLTYFGDDHKATWMFDNGIRNKYETLSEVYRAIIDAPQKAGETA